MKQKILEALKAKFVGVSDAILSRIADKLAKTTTKEEEVTTAVEGVTLASVLESYGDARATEAQQTAVANYEKKHNLKDGKPIVTPPTPPTPPKNDEPVPEWAKALVETNKALTERLNKFEQGNITSARKKQLSEIINKLPETLRKGYERMNLDSLSDEDFTKTLGDVTSEVDAIVKETKQKGTIFGAPSFHGGTVVDAKKATDAEAKAVVDKLNL